MSKFVETLRLKELAEEDIYFARRDQERIQALHDKRLAVAADPEKQEACQGIREAVPEG